MLDIKFIRENVEAVKQACINKKKNVDVDLLLKLDAERKDLKTQIDGTNKKRNDAAKSKDFDAGKKLKTESASLDEKFKEIDDKFNELLWAIPNIYSEDTPIGTGEEQNIVLRKNGTIPAFSFNAKEHWELGEALGVIDNERAAKVSGSRFTYLKGDIALMEFALVQFALSVLTDESKITQIVKKAGLRLPTKPFVPVVPPVLIKPEAFDRMARLDPKDERYHIPEDDLYLVGSAEHTLGAMHMDETLTESVLPARYVGFSTSFRREAGSYGKDTKGILRMHQFDKLEMEVFSTAESGTNEQLLIVNIQEYLMTALGLPHQVIAICTGDMGGPDFRQYDIETWMPGQDRYRETQTSDYNTDYQARRLNTRVRRADGKIEFVHMNDATVFAIGRTIIAIMENNQAADGSVRIPEALQQFMFGKKEIKKV